MNNDEFETLIKSGYIEEEDGELLIIDHEYPEDGSIVLQKKELADKLIEKEKEKTLKPFTREDMRRVAIVVINDVDHRISWASEEWLQVYDGFKQTYRELLDNKIQGYTFDGELINLWHEVTE